MSSKWGFLGAVILPIIAYKIIEMLPKKQQEKTKAFLSIDSPTFSRPLLKNPVIWALAITLLILAAWLGWSSYRQSKVTFNSVEEAGAASLAPGTRIYVKGHGWGTVEE